MLYTVLRSSYSLHVVLRMAKASSQNVSKLYTEHEVVHKESLLLLLRTMSLDYWWLFILFCLPVLESDLISVVLCRFNTMQSSAAWIGSWISGRKDQSASGWKRESSCRPHCHQENKQKYWKVRVPIIHLVCHNWCIGLSTCGNGDISACAYVCHWFAERLVKQKYLRRHQLW